jgi:hypothetical protein
MAQVKIDKLSIRMRGVSRADARRAIAGLAPALQRALAQSTAPIAAQRQVDVRVPRGPGALADRIAAPVSAALRGERKR